jgi:hypothetical protein
MVGLAFLRKVTFFFLDPVFDPNVTRSPAGIYMTHLPVPPDTMLVILSPCQHPWQAGPRWFAGPPDGHIANNKIISRLLTAMDIP